MGHHRDISVSQAPALKALVDNYDSRHTAWYAPQLLARNGPGDVEKAIRIFENVMSCMGHHRDISVSQAPALKALVDNSHTTVLMDREPVVVDAMIVGIQPGMRPNC
jgi:hypothetical protein